jgi:hypothetical protein
MRYLRLTWRHQLPDEPVLLYNECNASGWEVRKVDVYRDGRTDRASSSGGEGTTFISSEPIPTVAEINADPQFEAVEIGAEEFERIWVASNP